jgi:hypothetical protein
MGTPLKIDFRDEPKDAFVSFEDATQYLERMCRMYRVRHLSYWSLTLTDGMPDQVTWIATYDPSYMSHYMNNYTPLGDPAFQDGEMKAGVIDWSTLNENDSTALAIQQAAAKFGITKHGLSYLFNDGPDLNIMFSVNVDCFDNQWADEKARIVGGICGFAHYFHKRAKQMVEARRCAA